MSINLEKRTQQVGIILAKRGLPVAPKTRVGVALDVSGSAKHFYENGVIQETLDRLLAVAMKFDDDGNLDAWTFDKAAEVMSLQEDGVTFDEDEKEAKVLALALYNLATAHVLCGPNMRVIVLAPEDTE